MGGVVTIYSLSLSFRLPCFGADNAVAFFCSEESRDKEKERE